MKGCTHIYFGDGKGKTTAAMGLAIRAAGNDKKVFIIQFLKGGPTGELKILLQQPNITILRGKPNTPFTTEVSSKIPCTYVPYMLSFPILLIYLFMDTRFTWVKHTVPSSFFP